jgi:hypothetical protein
LTYERPSAAALNGRSDTVPDGGYTAAELALRTGVPHPAGCDRMRAPLPPGDGREHYAAIDVVRLAVVDRLVRSGVPVARAIALVRAAESRVSATIRAGQGFPNSGTGVQTGPAMTPSH